MERFVIVFLLKDNLSLHGEKEIGYVKKNENAP
jgi:hypothetical protein